MWYVLELYAYPSYYNYVGSIGVSMFFILSGASLTLSTATPVMSASYSTWALVQQNWHKSLQNVAIVNAL